jgi:hypothetical protein
MPSSSTTTTHLETSLITTFRPIFMHLSLSARWEELDYLLDTFSQTLDLSDHSLQLAFYPSSLPWQERSTAAVRAEIEALDRVRARSAAMKGSMWCGFERVLGRLAWDVEAEGEQVQGVEVVEIE